MTGVRDWSRKEIVLLCVLLAIALLIRAWIIPHRWINPDEGAHLMDGVLLLEGLVPGVDYLARHVVYVHLTGLAVSILGNDLFQLRFFPVLVTLLAGTVIHLIGRLLYGPRAGLTAAALFLLLPFSALMTVQTKTEPLAILSATGAVYFVVRAHAVEDRGTYLLVLAGVCAGLAYYVRPSTVAVLPALVLGLWLNGRADGGGTLRALGALLAGIAAVSVAVAGYYLRFLPLDRALIGPGANPLFFVAGQFQAALDAITANANGGGGGTFTNSDHIGLERTLRNLYVSVRTTAVAAVGTAVALAVAAARWTKSRLGDEPFRYGVPVAWAVFVVLAYLFWTAKRGFFPAYFLEILPPLSLLAGAGVTWCWRRLPGDRSWRTHVGMLATATGILLTAHLWAEAWQISRPLYFFVTLLVVAAFYLPPDPCRPGEGTRHRWMAVTAGVAIVSGVVVGIGPHLPPLASAPLYLTGAFGGIGLVLMAAPDRWRERPVAGVAVAVYTLIVSSLFLSFSESGVHLDERFHAAWSPETLERTARLLTQHTDSGHTVASGAVIWEVQADRLPFAKLSHPLALKTGSAHGEVHHLRRKLSTSPPDAVVLDGYTEQTYFAVLPELREKLEVDYRWIATVHGSRHPVRLYLRSPGDAADAAGGRPTSPP